MLRQVQIVYSDNLVQDCGNSSVSGRKLMQSCAMEIMYIKGSAHYCGDFSALRMELVQVQSWPTESIDFMRLVFTLSTDVQAPRVLTVNMMTSSNRNIFHVTGHLCG